MNLSASSVIKQIIDFFKKLAKGTKILIFTFLGVAVVAAIVISVLANNGKYTVLYRGLAASEGAQVMSYLDSAAVNYKVERDGSILVPTQQVASLKMQLAAEGYPNSALSYDLFTNNSDLLTTDYEKKKLLIFQLQDRLQKSIMTLQSVKNAIVTLSIPEENHYVLKGEEKSITASVLLDIHSNAELTSKQIKGIERLVANSVPGLVAEHVAIIGSDGTQLNNLDQNNGSGSAGSKFETINLINTLYARKIEKFLAPVFGVGGISISVNVDVDFKTVTSDEIIYTPVIGDNGIIVWEERSKTTEGKGGSGSDIPTYEESVINSGPVVIGDEQYRAEYLVNQLVRKIQDDGGNVKDVTVAVIINQSTLSDEDKNTYRELIAYGAGVSTDKVTVTNAKFVNTPISNETPPENKTPGIVFDIKLGTIEIIIIAAGLFVFLMLTIFIAIIRRKRKRKNKKKPDLQDMLEKAMASGSQGNSKWHNYEGVRPEDLPGEIVPNETREQALKRQIKEYTNNNPETVAQLLRVWIKEDDE